ncbi:hypothetical protein [Coleofasciculus sp. FACHB-SPT9]|uniref:hypothetical protein n=1 Tax=Cyanophyceae TaxID=3028117 RepID=UPI0016894D36|nr:hypothetical protein [Coleofasciculus sp. FACHB-SPT9]MBD1889484.1 hypothetical protein [Coleofasciculus sp. FACHB-SPT9]
MPKIPECDRCQLNPRIPSIVCAVHPTGPDSDRCLDFRPAAEPPELWAPPGTRFVDNELVLEQPTYDGEPVPVPRQRFTPEEKLELLDYHPLFTGRCPHCEMPFDMNNLPPVHWDCAHCGWIDDSV